MPDQETRTLDIVAQLKQCGILPANDLGEMEALLIAEAITELMETSGKPVSWWTATGSKVELEAELERRGMAIFPSGERAIRALRKLGDYWQFLQTCSS